MSSVPPTPPVVETAPTRPWQVTVSAVLMAITGFFWQLCTIGEVITLIGFYIEQADFGSEHYLILLILQVSALLCLRNSRDLWLMVPRARRHAIILSAIGCVFGAVVSVFIGLFSTIDFSETALAASTSEGIIIGILALTPTIVFTVVPLILLTRWPVKRAFEKIAQQMHSTP